jgi:hypothetical protein
MIDLKGLRGLLIAVPVVLGASALAAGDPDCYDDNGKALAIDNQQALQWKTSTPNEYHGRAHVKGTYVRSYKHTNGHTHFEARIGDGASDTIEIVYNDDFGALTAPTAGESIEACGDFINSFKPTSQYQPSPDGALMHWLHENPDGTKHPDGYLVIGDQVYGDQDNE